MANSKANELIKAMREKADQAAAELEVQHQLMHEKAKKEKEERRRKEQERVEQIAVEKREEEFRRLHEEKRRIQEKEAEKTRKASSLQELMQKQREADLTAEQRWLRHQIDTGILKVALNSARVWVSFPADSTPDAKGTPIDVKLHSELVSELTLKVEAEARALSAITAPPPQRKLQVRTVDTPWIKPSESVQPPEPKREPIPTSPPNLQNLILSPRKAFQDILEASKSSAKVEEQAAAKPAPQRFASLARRESQEDASESRANVTTRARELATSFERRTSVSEQGQVRSPRLSEVESSAASGSSLSRPVPGKLPTLVAATSPSTKMSMPAASPRQPQPTSPVLSATSHADTARSSAPNPAPPVSRQEPAAQAVVVAPVSQDVLYGNDSAPAEPRANPENSRQPMEEIYGDEQNVRAAVTETVYGNDESQSNSAAAVAAVPQARPAMQEIYGDEQPTSREPMQEIYGDESKGTIYGNSDTPAAQVVVPESEFVYSHLAQTKRPSATSGVKAPVVVATEQVMYNTVD